MAYILTQDIIDRIGEDELYVIADRDRDGVLDQDAIDRAAADSEAEINVYVGKKYDLPLPSVPVILIAVGVDITVYKLADRSGALTEERRQRYEDALSLLGKIASGAVDLGIENTPASSRGSAVLISPPRRFGRGKGGMTQ